MTVCTKLFSIVRPTRVYVGAKDAAQCIVLSRMVRELDLPLELIVCDTLRETDGLAMSSRNRYLSTDDRRRATVISGALFAGQALFDSNQRATFVHLDDIVRATLAQEPTLLVEYISIADLSTGAELRDRNAFLLRNNRCCSALPDVLEQQD
jgi:pantoate--beta-alanine ligase